MQVKGVKSSLQRVFDRLECKPTQHQKQCPTKQKSNLIRVQPRNMSSDCSIVALDVISGIP